MQLSGGSENNTSMKHAGAAAARATDAFEKLLAFAVTEDNCTSGITRPDERTSNPNPSRTDKLLKLVSQVNFQVYALLVVLAGCAFLFMALLRQ